MNRERPGKGRKTQLKTPRRMSRRLSVIGRTHPNNDKANAREIAEEEFEMVPCVKSNTLPIHLTCFDGVRHDLGEITKEATRRL